MQEVTLDFETYFDSEYSISKMTTIEYILDPRFEVMGLSIKLNANDTFYVDDPADVHEALYGINWQDSELVGHNLLFDGGILANRFQIYPMVYRDTAAMARTALNFLRDSTLETVARYLEIGEKDRTALYNVEGKHRIDLTPEEREELKIYCIGDSDKSYAILHKLKPYISEKELRLIDITVRMFTHPQLRLDPVALEEFIKELEEERAQLVEESGLTIKQLRSTGQLSEIIRRLGAEVPKKPSPKDPSKIIDTFEKINPETAKLLVHSNPQIRKIVRARLNVMSSININRAKRFKAIHAITGGFLPAPLRYAQAHTGRWGGSDKLNLQNMPREGRLRSCIIAPPHHVVCVADLSQIEARLTAWLAEHIELLRKFADPNIDVYSDFASVLYDIALEDIAKDSLERFVGKQCILGLGFGMGWKRMFFDFNSKWPEVGLTEEDAIHAVDTYRSVNYPIKILWGHMDNIIARMAFMEDGMEKVFKCISYGRNHIRLPSGRCLMYPNLRLVPQKDEDGKIMIDHNGNPYEEWMYSHKGSTRKIYGGKLTENVVQALARDLVGDHMVEIDEKCAQVALTVHDEIITVPHRADADKIYERMVEFMKCPPKWAPDLPLNAEGGYNERYIKW